MYEERRESFSLKDIILQLLFIVLLVFILIWLFPTKGYLEKKLDGIESSVNDKLKPLYTRLFTDNIETMKDAAKSYYTTPRLPQNVGDTAKMTLGEMYEKGLLLELVDSNNNACDTTKSYVELTKMEDEYQLKTVLSCSDKEAFVIEYLGCYDYCNGKLCSKAESTANQATSTGTTSTKKYKYQYVLNTGGTCSDYGSWSDWTTNKIEENSNTKVDTKTDKVLDHYEQVYGVVDTKYVSQPYYEQVSFGYSTRTIKRTTTYNYTTKTTTKVVAYAKRYNTTETYVPYSTRTIKKTTTYAYSYKKEATGTKWVDAGRIETTSTKSSTSTVKYTFVSSRKELDCNNTCKTVNYYTYDVQKLETTYKTTKYCAQGEENSAKTACVVTTYVKRNYCAQGDDNGKNCTISANQTVLYCEEGKDNGSGCAITTTSKYCAQGDDTGSGCAVVTYLKQNYCSTGTDTGSGCVTTVQKTKQVAQLVYGYTNGDPVYKNVTSYRSKTKTCTGGTTDYQWSTSNDDAALKAKGYTLTGVTQEIN